MSIRRKTGALSGALLLGLPITFFLEVVGASGAIWGGSDLVGLRNDENKEAWSSLAAVLGVLALTRFTLKFKGEPSNPKLQNESFMGAFAEGIDTPFEAIKNVFFESKETISSEPELQMLLSEYNKAVTKRSRLGLLTGLLFGVTTLVTLEVIGASGAAWGGSEVTGLRNADNKIPWTFFSLILGAFAAVRYFAKYFHENPKPKRYEESFGGALGQVLVAPHAAVADQFKIVAPSSGEKETRSYKSKTGAVMGAVFGLPISFFLEVVGAAGAAWGASEAFGLRDAENKELWVPFALTLGAFALVRYGLSFYRETANRDRSESDFSGAFWHAVDAPREAIKDQFFEYKNTENTSINALYL